MGKGKGEVDNFKNNLINKRLKKNFSKSQLTLINLIVYISTNSPEVYSIADFNRFKTISLNRK